MSAIVQLSYNINEKLRLDDHTFSGFEARSAELPNHTSTIKPTSFSKSESIEQWSTVTCVNTSSASIDSGGRLIGASGPVAGQSCPKFDNQRAFSIHRSEIQPITLPKTSSKAKDVTETAVYKLCDSSSHKKSYSFNQQDKVHSSKSSLEFNVRCIHSAEQPTEAFPRIIGKSCTLHLPKDQVSAGTNLTDVPPIKKHCRSVSELDNLGVSPYLSPWKPVAQSRVWVPIQRLNSSNKSFSSCSSRFFNDCSRSLDYSSLRSRESCFGSSHLTPPASPVPRPASVTVIKQESGAWTFLSSQKVLSEQDQSALFSPLSSGFMSPSSRLREVSKKSSPHTGLAATKRSLSFSADFEHRKSIEYTPVSTPELNKRLGHDPKRGGLPRCQSHPSGLNMKRMKGRRKSRLCHYRPTLDFAKMKQTAMSKRGRIDDFGRLPKNSGDEPAADISQVLSISPVFPSLVTADSSLKKNKLKTFGPIRSTSPVNLPVSFSIDCNKPLSAIHHRIPSPTDEAPLEPDDEADPPNKEGAGGASMFVPECPDLNVDDIENETDD